MDFAVLWLVKFQKRWHFKKIFEIKLGIIISKIFPLNINFEKLLS